VWDITLAPTYEQAAAGSSGQFGESSPYPYFIPPLGMPTAAYARTNLATLAPHQVPEPGTGVLLILGLVGLWWRGRRLRQS